MNESIFVAEQDIFGYLADKYTANNQLSCVITFNGKIDQNLLKDAIELTLKEQPILACRLIEENDSLSWKYCNDLEQANYFSILETQDITTELQKFITTPFCFEQDCQLKVCLFPGDVDTLCVKVHHTCADGSGLKQCVLLLTKIYNQLANNQPQIEKSTFFGNRSQQQILSIPEVSSVMNHLETSSDAPSMIHFPESTGESSQQTFLTGTLQSDEFALLREYAKHKGGTINDVLLTAYIRALSNIGQLQNDTLSVNLTIDLRRYLPNKKVDAIANLSSGEFITLDQITSDTFDEALSKIMKATQKMKQNNPGVRGMLSLGYIAALPWKEADSFFRNRREQALQSKCCIPYFSNLGVISDTQMSFGSTQISGCYTVGQALYAPGLIMLASTYQNSLTIAVNFYQATTPGSEVKKLIDTMMQELHSLLSY